MSLTLPIRLMDALNKITDRTPEFDDSHCLNQLHQRAGQCTACADACPLAAIVLDPTPQIDPSICLACDTCAAVCPGSALQGQRSPLKIWREARQATQEGVAVLVCRAVGVGRFAATRIPCVGGLPPEFYISLTLAGVKNITIYTADCKTCPLRTVLGQAQSAADYARRFLDKIGDNFDLKYCVGTPPPDESIAPTTAISRRGFLSVFKPNAPKLVDTDILDKLMATGVGWRRALLLGELLRTSTPSQVKLPSQEGCGGALAVSDRCIGCQMCTQFCPTGALAATVNDQDSKVTLLFSAARCVACGLCERVCLKRAISLRSEVALDAITNSDFVPIWAGSPATNPLRTSAKRVGAALSYTSAAREK